MVNFLYVMLVFGGGVLFTGRYQHLTSAASNFPGPPSDDILRHRLTVASLNGIIYGLTNSLYDTSQGDINFQGLGGEKLRQKVRKACILGGSYMFMSSPFRLYYPRVSK